MNRAQHLEQIRERVYDNLQKAREYQKRYYDRKKAERSYQVGDYVWIDLTNITTQRFSKKLDSQRWGKCRVIERIGSQAYRVELLRIHDAFHVSLLHQHHEMEGVNSEPRFPLRLASESEREYRVHKIIDSRTSDGRLEYKVHWEGYPRNKATWEPATNLRHLRQKIGQ